MSRTTKENAEPSLLYLLSTFLIIGSVSFGGYSSLVAMVKERLVDKRKLLEDAVIIEGFTLASLLPGPVAVNTVAYIGYYLRGWGGAIISFIAVILPSFMFVVGLTFFYLKYSELPAVSGFLMGVTPVILSIILSVSYKLGKSNILTYKQLIVLFLGLLIQIFINGYLSFIICLIAGGIIGVLLINVKEQAIESSTEVQNKQTKSILKPILIVTAVIIPVIAWIVYGNSINSQLAETFGKVSLSLFGGGYVMIPILEQILVDELNWLTTQEFVDAIAIGQVTPGPILISAAFVGFKLNGILGASVATMFIFAPSATVMILLSSKIEKVKANVFWNKAMNGIKPIVISFILYSIWVIFSKINYLEVAIPIFILSSFLLIKYKVNFIYLVIASGVLGFFFF